MAEDEPVDADVLRKRLRHLIDHFVDGGRQFQCVGIRLLLKGNNDGLAGFYRGGTASDLGPWSDLSDLIEPDRDIVPRFPSLGMGTIPT